MFSGVLKFLFKNDFYFVDYRSTICPLKTNVGGENTNG